MVATKTDRATITVINPVMWKRNRPAPLTWVRIAINTLVGVMVLTFYSSVQGATRTAGIVTNGAFLISEKPNVKREGHYVHGLVGYLPIGTRVYVEKNKAEKIKNRAEGRLETYYPASSSIGVHGLLREDRFVLVKDKPLAVVVSLQGVPLHNSDPSKRYESKIKIGRYDGAWLEITGDADEEFFRADLNRRNGTSEALKTKSVRLWREYVKKGSVILVEPSTLEEHSPPVPEWSEAEKPDDNWIREKLNGFSSEKIRRFLGFVYDIECLVRGSAAIELGVKFLGNGLSFDLSTDLKDQGHMFRLWRQRLNMNDGESSYLILKNIRCDGSRPERLLQYTLREEMADPESEDRKDAFVRLEDLAADQSQWTLSLTGTNAPFRMVRISNEQDYQKILKRLEELAASSSDGFIAQIPPEKRDVLLNFIVREISYFNHRDLTSN